MDSLEKTLGRNYGVRFDIGGLHFHDLKNPTPEELEGIKAYERMMEVYIDCSTRMV